MRGGKWGVAGTSHGTYTPPVVAKWQRAHPKQRLDPTLTTGEAKELKAYDLPPDERLRLGGKRVGDDHWFRYDGGLFRRAPSFDELSDRVCELVETQGEEWWSS